MTPLPLVALGLASLCFAPAVTAQLPPVPVPAENPITADKSNLGKVLFWDEQMGATRNVACGTCHRPDAGGGDPRAAFAINPGPDGIFATADDIHGSPGVPRNFADGTYGKHPIFGLDVQVTGRLAPSMINAAFNSEQFWDGRAVGTFVDPADGTTVISANLASLESQASGPPVADSEMANEGRTWADCADRIRHSAPLALVDKTLIPTALNHWIGSNTYPQLFQRVFGDPTITPARIVQAIATYERTLISDQTPFDLGTMTPQQTFGWNVFNNKARCFLCHEGSLFRDDAYHNIGLRPASEDLGRFGITNNPDDRGAFKTPGLRNLALRTAFMHNGMHGSLAEVIDFYDRGGDFFDNLDPAMKPLALTLAEKGALLDFLRNALLDPRVANKQHPFDPPVLFTQTANAPQGYGEGARGSGDFEPRLIANEPPMLGNPNMTLALTEGFGGGMAALALDTQQGPGLPIMGVPILLGMSGNMVIVPLGPLNDAGAGEGWWTGTFAVPSEPTLAGTKLFGQAYVADPGAALGVSGTAGIEIIFFAPR